MAAIYPDGHLAAAAQSSQRCALDRDGEPRIGVVEKADRLDGRCVIFAGFNAERALPGGRTKFFRIEPLAHPVGPAQAVEPGGGEQNRLYLPFGQLAQPRVNIASKLDQIEVGPQRL